MASRNNGDYHEMSGQQAFDQRQNDDRARQDAQLDQIYNGVRGLKGQAHAINGEVVEQNAMVDDISNRMDDAHGDLERQEASARNVNAKKKHACKLYGVIALLIVVLIVLFIIPSPTS